MHIFKYNGYCWRATRFEVVVDGFWSTVESISKLAMLGEAVLVITVALDGQAEVLLLS